MKNKLLNKPSLLMGRNCFVRKILPKLFSLGLAGIIAFTPVTSYAVVRDNLSSMDTSATATSSDLLENETAWVNGSKITGTMTDKSGITTTSSTVTQSNNNVVVTIPTKAFYSTNSKLSISVDKVKANCASLNLTPIINSINGKRTDSLTSNATPQEIATIIDTYWIGDSRNANITYTYHSHTGSSSTKSGCYITPVYHVHTGNSTNGGGCYTQYNAPHTHNSSCSTCSKSVSYNDSEKKTCTCNQSGCTGVNYKPVCPTHGTRPRRHSKTSYCGVYTCGKSTTAYYSISCGKTEGVTIDKYELGCGKSTTTIDAAYIVYD